MGYELYQNKKGRGARVDTDNDQLTRRKRRVTQGGRRDNSYEPEEVRGGR